MVQTGSVPDVGSLVAPLSCSTTHVFCCILWIVYYEEQHAVYGSGAQYVDRDRPVSRTVHVGRSCLKQAVKFQHFLPASGGGQVNVIDRREIRPLSL